MKKMGIQDENDKKIRSIKWVVAGEGKYVQCGSKYCVETLLISNYTQQNSTSRGLCGVTERGKDGEIESLSSGIIGGVKRTHILL